MSRPTIDCLFTQAEIPGTPGLEHSVVAVIDVLRATTTIIAALTNGAREILPVGTVSEARCRLTQQADANTLLAGERGGHPPKGFHLGNSPAEFTPEKVRNHSILLTTTNGSQAIIHARTAYRIYIAAFRNIDATIAVLSERRKPLLVLCAGQDCKPSVEDLVCAGMLIRHLSGGGKWQLTERAEEAIRWFQLNTKRKGAILQQAPHAQTLVKLGYAADVEDCYACNQSHVVPYGLFKPGDPIRILCRR